METSQPNVAISKSKLSPKEIIIPLVVLILGLFIGVAADRTLLYKPSAPILQQTTKPQITQKDLPIALSLLQNPIITQWRAGVEGTLIAKNKDTRSITLSRNGVTLTIPLAISPAPTNTTFFNSEELMKKGKPSRITLEQIPVGSYLRGDFFVIPDKEGSKDRIVGSSFTLVATTSAQSTTPNNKTSKQ